MHFMYSGTACCQSPVLESVSLFNACVGYVSGFNRRHITTDRHCQRSVQTPGSIIGTTKIREFEKANSKDCILNIKHSEKGMNRTT